MAELKQVSPPKLSLYNKLDRVSVLELSRDSTVGDNPRHIRAQKVTCTVNLFLTAPTHGSRRLRHDGLAINRVLEVSRLLTDTTINAFMYEAEL